MTEDRRTVVEPEDKDKLKLYWAHYKRDYYQTIGAQEEYRLDGNLPDDRNDVYTRNILGLGPTVKKG